MLASPAPREWLLSAEESAPRDHLYRALLMGSAELSPGVVDTSLLGDAGLRMRAAGIHRLLVMEGPEPGSVLLGENPRDDLADPAAGARALQMLGSSPPPGTWAAVMAVSAGGPAGIPAGGPPPAQGTGAVLAAWMEAVARHTRHSPLSARGAQVLAGCLGAEHVLILRPERDGLAVAAAGPDGHRQGRAGLAWPLPTDREALFRELDVLAGRRAAGTWQVLVAERGELAVAVSPPSAEHDALVLITNFLAAEAERGRTTREGRQRSLLEERMRIAGLIHDGVTQQVSSVVIQLQLLELAAQEPEKVKEAARAAREGTQVALEELRASLFELAPRLPEWEDLVSGLRSFAEDYSAQWGIDVTVIAEDGAPDLDPETMMLAFSVVQECLTNVRKHADADSVAVTVSFTREELSLAVEDDGNGFPTAPAGPTGKGETMGLRLLQDRVRQAGGSVRITSTPGQGASVLVTMPLWPPD